MGIDARSRTAWVDASSPTPSADIYRPRVQQRQLSRPRSLVSAASPFVTQTEGTKGQGARKQEQPDNALARRLPAVFGRVRAGSGAECRRRNEGAGSRLRCRHGAGRGAAVTGAGGGVLTAWRGATTGTILTDATSSSRRLSGSSSVSLSSLPLICTQRPIIALVTPLSSLSSCRASAPGSAVHVPSGTLSTGPRRSRAST